MSIEILNIEQRAAKVVELWGTAPNAPEQAQQQREQLLALGDRPRPGDVAAIVGWHQFSLWCDECEHEVTEVVEFSGRYSGCFHDDVVRVCQHCLRESVDKLFWSKVDPRS
jgi:hypothetical protein